MSPISDTPERTGQARGVRQACRLPCLRDGQGWRRAAIGPAIGHLQQSDCVITGRSTLMTLLQPQNSGGGGKVTREQTRHWMQVDARLSLNSTGFELKIQRIATNSSARSQVIHILAICCMGICCCIGCEKIGRNKARELTICCMDICSCIGCEKIGSRALLRVWHVHKTISMPSQRISVDRLTRLTYRKTAKLGRGCHFEWNENRASKTSHSFKSSKYTRLRLPPKSPYLNHWNARQQSTHGSKNYRRKITSPSQPTRNIFFMELRSTTSTVSAVSVCASVTPAVLECMVKASILQTARARLLSMEMERQLVSQEAQAALSSVVLCSVMCTSSGRELLELDLPRMGITASWHVRGSHTRIPIPIPSYILSTFCLMTVHATPSLLWLLTSWRSRKRRREFRQGKFEPIFPIWGRRWWEDGPCNVLNSWKKDLFSEMKEWHILVDIISFHQIETKKHISSERG